MIELLDSTPGGETKSFSAAQRIFTLKASNKVEIRRFEQQRSIVEKWNVSLIGIFNKSQLQFVVPGVNLMTLEARNEVH